MEASTSGASELTSQLSCFFDRLVSLIPAKFYRSDEEGTHVELRHLKAEERAAAKQGFKAKSKAAKLAKLDPSGSGQQQQVHGDDKEGPSSSGRQPPASSPPPALLNIPANNVSRTELQEKLQQRLESMRQQRQHVDKAEAVKKAKDWKQKALENSVKAKQQQEQQKQKQQQQGQKGQRQDAGAKRKADGEAGPKPKKQAEGQQQAQGQQQQQGEGGGFAFPRIEVDEGRPGQHGHHKGGKKPTKEQLLKAAEAKEKERQAGAQAEGAQPKQEAWKSALLRASGEKVLDDPKLLRKSLKKDAKRKEKSAKAWQERNQAQEEAAAAKQSKRKENLQARATGKVEKKKAQREKKLLGPGAAGKKAAGAAAGPAPARAGFEGRRSGFIGDKAAK